MKNLFVILFLCFLSKSSVVYCQQVVLYEGFESGVLNPMITVQTVGAFNSYPGIKSNSNFGSTKAFGFGISTCPANCFYNYTSKLIITFPAPTYVDSIKWSEMELFGNWGSWGDLYIDGIAVTDTGMGLSPQNSLSPDAFPRNQVYGVNQTVTTIELYVVDITAASEITIDDLEITGNTTGINEIEANNIFIISPNPSAGNFVVSFSKQVNRGNIEIANIIGETVYRVNVYNELKNEIELENIADGIYFVKVYNGETYSCEKIIIERE